MDNKHIGYIAVLAAFAIVVIMLDSTASRYLAQTTRNKCAASMRGIVSELEVFRSQQPATNYPARLGELDANGIGPAAFVCPGSGLKAGAPANLDQWTDYIYVADLRPDRPAGEPILLCPPANHGRKLGGAVDSYGDVRWMPASEFAALVEALEANTNLVLSVSDAVAKRGRLRVTE